MLQQITLSGYSETQPVHLPEDNYREETGIKTAIDCGLDGNIKNVFFVKNDFFEKFSEPKETETEDADFEVVDQTSPEYIEALRKYQRGLKEGKRLLDERSETGAPVKECLPCEEIEDGLPLIPEDDESDFIALCVLCDSILFTTEEKETGICEDCRNT